MRLSLPPSRLTCRATTLDRQTMLARLKRSVSSATMATAHHHAIGLPSVTVTPFLHPAFFWPEEVAAAFTRTQPLFVARLASWQLGRLSALWSFRHFDCFGTLARTQLHASAFMTHQDMSASFHTVSLRLRVSATPASCYGLVVAETSSPRDSSFTSTTLRPLTSMALVTASSLRQVSHTSLRPKD